MQWTSRRLPFVFLAAFTCATVILSVLPFASAASGPFANFADNWTGTGTVRSGANPTERIRCNASYRPRGSTQHEVELQLRCASDNYNFDLSGEFTADEQNQITGRWTERTRGVGGTAIGGARGERLQIHVESAGFAAELVLLTV